MVGFFVAVALLAPLISPYDPHFLDREIGSLEPPSGAHLLGTDDAGHDILSRLIWGSRTVLVVLVTATALTMLIGVMVGATAGLRGGLVDSALMRLVDVFLAVPRLPVVIFIIALANRASLSLTIFAIVLFAWAEPARIIRSQTLTLRTRGYVDSARGFGAGPFYVIRRHLAPALGPIIGANLVWLAGSVIVIETALGFLGLADPGAVSWGADIERAMANGTFGWTWLWWMLPLGLALTFAIFGFTLIGVGLEPEFNPRANRR